MKKISEEFLHFLWKNQHLTGVTYYTAGDFNLKVIDPGFHNHDEGPDFFNAKVIIDETTWAGNVELHINASDWIKHGHTHDPSYNSVILHVVYFNDCTITRENGDTIPTAILRFPVLIWDKYENLKKNKNWIACQQKLYQIRQLDFVQWTSSLLVQKLEEKATILNRQLEDVKSHWDALLTRNIIRSFGLPVNVIPFELLGQMVPYTWLLRNKDSLFTLEAMLFGKSGFLDHGIPEDKYMESLRKQYLKFSCKHSCISVPRQSWKFMRMRPSSFPTVRLAQLASLIHDSLPLHEKLTTMPEINTLPDLFKATASNYWSKHYLPGKESHYLPKHTGDSFIRKIIINAIVPYLSFYGSISKQDKYLDYAIHLLENLPAEDNRILKNWGTFGMICTNALESQALLYLFSNYCKHRRCLNCQFGNKLLTGGKVP